MARRGTYVQHFQGLLRKITSLKMKMKGRSTHKFPSGLKMDGRRIWEDIDRRWRFKIYHVLNRVNLQFTDVLKTSVHESELVMYFIALMWMDIARPAKPRSNL